MASNATPAGAHAVKLDGTSHCRSTAEENECFGRSVGNSPAARSKILRRGQPCDSPRRGIGPARLGTAAGRRGCASGATVRDVGGGLGRWRDTVDSTATATSGGPLADRLRCNIAPADAVAGKGVHSLSTGKDAAGSTPGLAWGRNGDILELGPREVLLPKVKPRREAPTSHRGDFLALRRPAEGKQASLSHFIVGTTS